MDNLDIRKKALSQLMGDMDGLEGESMFGGKGDESPKGPMSGVDVTISVEPKHADLEEAAPEEEDDDEEGLSEDEMRGLPPMFRKK